MYKRQEIDIIQYSRDSCGRKTCTLIIEGKHKARQVENLTCYYKKYEEKSRIPFNDVRKEYLNYYGKLYVWFNKNTETEKMSSKVTQATSSKIEEFISNIVANIGKSKKKELGFNLMQFLKQNPLLIYSLERID